MPCAAFAIAVLIGVELFFVKDAFGTRMNTVFKLHYNAWVFTGLAAAVGLATVMRSHLVALPAAALLSLVVLAGLVYPLSAIQTRLAEAPAGGATLDGLTFLDDDEAIAVAWLRGTCQG